MDNNKADENNEDVKDGKDRKMFIAVLTIKNNDSGDANKAQHPYYLKRRAAGRPGACRLGLFPL